MHEASPRAFPVPDVLLDSIVLLTLFFRLFRADELRDGCAAIRVRGHLRVRAPSSLSFQLVRGFLLTLALLLVTGILRGGTALRVP